MNKLRLSYSLLSLWERGDIDGAVATYFHLDRPVNKAMVRGREVHREIEEYIQKHRKTPDWFFNWEFDSPEPEKEVVVSYNELFNLKGIFDCLDGKTLFEFKTGNTDALAWARTWQLPIYFLIAELAEIEIEKALIIRHDFKESDFAIVHNSQSKRDDARNRIDSLGPEIYDYFIQQGLLPA
jgi:hypothetical protein